MFVRQGLLGTALTLAVVLGTAAESRAAYMYSVTPSVVATSQTADTTTGPGSLPSVNTTIGSGTGIQIGGKSSMDLDFRNDLSLADLIITKSVLPPFTADNFTVDYRLDVTITNPQPPAPSPSSFTFQIFGTMTIASSVGPGGQSLTVDNVYTSILPTSPMQIGDQLFSVYVPIGDPSNQYFSKPTINGAAGGFSARITAVPEPASVVLLSLGGLGVLGLLRARMRTD